MTDLEPGLQLHHSPHGTVDMLDVPQEYETMMYEAACALDALGYQVTCVSANPNRFSDIDISGAEGRVWGFWPHLGETALRSLSDHLGTTVLPAPAEIDSVESSQAAA